MCWILLKDLSTFLVDTVVRYCENKNSSIFPSNEFFCFRNSSVLGNTGPKILLGDIISDDETLRFITQDPRGRNAINYPHGLWPANTVPYIIDSSIGKYCIRILLDTCADS